MEGMLVRAEGDEKGYKRGEGEEETDVTNEPRSETQVRVEATHHHHSLSARSPTPKPSRSSSLLLQLRLLGSASQLRCYRRPSRSSCSARPSLLLQQELSTRPRRSSTSTWSSPAYPRATPFQREARLGSLPARLGRLKLEEEVEGRSSSRGEGDECRG